MKLAWAATLGSTGKATWVVFRKELVDALRDRRTLFMAFLTSIAIGPAVLVLVASLMGDLERQAEQRVVLMADAQDAPSLVNYIERQGFRVVVAPADHEARLRAGMLGDAVLAVGRGFEDQLARDEGPMVEVLGNGSHAASSAATRRLMALLQGFNQERAQLRMVMVGVSPHPAAIDVQERDLANRQARAAQLLAMVPFIVLMAVLYGSMAAAMDTTAGERERGSLEPLLMNPASTSALVVGKWAAVAAVGMLIALLSCVSFFPAQMLMRSEWLAALFQFGVREAGLFLVVLVPFAAAASALMMAAAIPAKTFKEAQTNNTGMVLLMTLTPTLSMINPDGEVAWHLWVPALGQLSLMSRVLKGGSLGWDSAITMGVCCVVVALALTYVAMTIRRAAVR